MSKTLCSIAITVATVAMAAVANAAPVDVADVVSDITGNLAPIAAIGSAVLGVYVAIKAFKWVRRAL